MKYFTPEISWHNKDPILSVDIQNKMLCSTLYSPNKKSYRFATCGNDSHVIIWKATIDDNYFKCKSSDIPLECLADLTRHRKPVNVVRFSPKIDDDLLAAGDDDGYIFIWKLCSDNIDVEMSDCSKRNTDNNNEEIAIIGLVDNKANQSQNNNNNSFDFENNDAISKEIWRPYKILRGHLQDVSDVCWSADGLKVASASVDNMSLVWDVHKGQKLYQIQNEHKGFVQGVAWDPLNKYLTTLSADRNMRVINCNNGRTIYRVHKTSVEDGKTSRLFYDDTLRSFCRRLAFSPGGELLIAPSGILELNGEPNDANNEFINTTYIFERKSLNKPSYYLPSSKYSIAVRCCPQLFQLHDDIENPFQFDYRIVFAVATQDSVLLYDSQQSLPFAHVSQIHYLRLTDISWSHDGRMLIVTSTDGFATFITFDDNELGIAYNGPLLNFDEIETPKTTSPISNTKASVKISTVAEEGTPEREKLVKKISTPAITSFFKKNENGIISLPPNSIEVISTPDKVDIEMTDTPAISAEKSVKTDEIVNGLKSDTPNINGCTPEMDKQIEKMNKLSIKRFFKPLKVSPTVNKLNINTESLSGNKRKEEVIDLTEDSEDSVRNHVSKKQNCTQSPQRNSNQDTENTANVNCKVKDTVRNLVDQFEEVKNDDKITSNEIEKIVPLEKSETKSQILSQQSLDSNPKQPRRIQFTTIQKSK